MQQAYAQDEHGVGHAFASDVDRGASLLQASLESLSRRGAAPASMHVTTTRSEAFGAADLSLIERFEVTLHRDGDRIDVFNRRYSYSGRDDATLAFESQVLWTGSRWLQRQQGIVGGQPDTSHSYAYTSAEPTYYERVRNGLTEGGPADGFTPFDDHHVAAILLEAHDRVVRPRTEKIDGVECAVIEGTHDARGHYTVWVDLAEGHLVRRARIVKTGQQLEPNPLSPTQWSKLECVIEHVRVAHVDGRTVPVEAEMTMGWTASDGSPGLRQWLKVEKSGMDFSPDFESAGAFITDAPPGTRFRDLDLGISYILQEDGSLSHAIPEDLLNSTFALSEGDE
ncbi:MAG TPA: hypothetical protein VMZ31_05320 [Phycisphaerae bacterium]|nr:hypothetical protein [Phycisphaerae bacterium]